MHRVLFLNYRSPTKLREVNVLTGVCLSFCSGWEGPMWALPMMHTRPQHTDPRPGPSPSPPPPTSDMGTPTSLDTIHGTHPRPKHPRHQTWGPLLVTSGGNHWRPVQTCPCEGHPPKEWHLEVAAEACTVSSGCFASYWNAFLLGKDLGFAMCYFYIITQFFLGWDYPTSTLWETSPNASFINRFPTSFT